MYLKISIVIDLVLLLLAGGGLILLLKKGRQHLQLTPAGYKLVLVAFFALLAGIYFEGKERHLEAAVGRLEIIGHLLQAGAIVALVAGLLSSLHQLSREVTLRREHETRLRHMALHDQLTGLANRSLFLEHLETAIERAARRKTMLGVLAIDLDGFKEINDRFGHATGDALLRDVAARLKRGVRGEDLVARLSGDEFIALAAEVGSPEQLAMIAERLLEMLDLPDGASGIAAHGSIGIAIYPKDGLDAQELLKQADIALYQAKAAGRHVYQFFDMGVEQKVRIHQRRLQELKQALVREELVLFYQPQVDVFTGTVRGAEALVRWLHPAEGLLPPSAFFPLAEEARMAALIDVWVIRHACREFVQWQRPGQELCIALNVSAQSVTPVLASAVAEILQETGVSPEALELELNATGLFASGESLALRAVSQLAALGVRLSIANFGTSQGSLAYLRSFPIHGIKIDPRFIQASPNSTADAAIVTSLLDMGRGLGLRVVAEGIETQEQLEFLRAHGCDTGQGFFFARPMPGAQLCSYLESSREGMHRSPLAFQPPGEASRSRERKSVRLAGS